MFSVKSKLYENAFEELHNKKKEDEMEMLMMSAKRLWRLDKKQWTCQVAEKKKNSQIKKKRSAISLQSKLSS